MEEEIIQKFKDLILNEHYCEDCNELCSIGEAFPLEFVAKYIIELEKENKILKKVDDIVEKIDTEKLMLKIEDDIEQDIEKLIEQLTKVRPEMLNEEALKLFNTIMAILDERDKLIEENKKLQECVNKEYQSGYSQGIYDSREAWKETIKEKIEELEKQYKQMEQTSDFIIADIIQPKIQVLQEFMEDK